MQVELAPHLSFRSLESGIPGPSRTWRKISLLSTYPMSFHFTFIYVLTVESESCAYIGITVIAFTFITAYGIDAVCIIRTRICTVQAFIVINTFAKSVTNKSDITLTFIRALWMGYFSVKHLRTILDHFGMISNHWLPLKSQWVLSLWHRFSRHKWMTVDPNLHYWHNQNPRHINANYPYIHRCQHTLVGDFRDHFRPGSTYSLQIVLVPMIHEFEMAKSVEPWLDLNPSKQRHCAE